MKKTIPLLFLILCLSSCFGTKAIQPSLIEEWVSKGNCFSGYGSVDKDCGRKDFKRAVDWYRKAAEHRHAWAQYRLGVMYKYGSGVPKDYKKAVSWYRRSAEQGHPDGQFNLGHMYHNGLGVTKSITNAKDWYRKACNNGEERACDRLKKLLGS